MLTPDQIKYLQRTVLAGREGRAPLSDLATAHDLAESSGLPGCAAELREHMQGQINLKNGPRTHLGKEVALGLATGMLTHHILRGL